MISVIKDNIVNLDVDCIVNAANTSLAGGGGVDGAIHEVAGKKLYEACNKIGYCAIGDAVITPGFNLKAKYIIHTVGPIYNRFDENNCKQLLTNCYKNSLDLARKYNIHSIAFPCISSGVYGYPIDKSANIAITTVKNWLNLNSYDIDVKLVCFTQKEYETYENINR